MLIFVLQTIWLYIKELAGKDLDIIVIAKFLLYFSPKLIPLVLPLTILLASIMVFGNFAENYEFAAMKSTGISLQRSMAGLSIFIAILGITTFFFSNNVIPWAEYNSFNLRKNIAKLKPAMAIAEGQFNEVGNINIKVAEKTGERGQYLRDVIIHKKSPKGAGNYTTIKANHGELIGEEDSDIIQLILFDGNYYDDTPPKDYKEKNKRPFVKSYFEKYIFNIDLSSLNNVDLDDKNFANKYNMLNMGELNYTIDSLKVEQKQDYRDFSKSLYNRSGLTNLDKGLNINIDSIQEKDVTITKNILSQLNVIKKVQLIDMAINSVTSTQQIISAKEQTLKQKNTWLNKHIMALHDKIALGFACIILFFVGAPLGALIRKGGIGLPMVIAILLFLTYHFIGIFAKNSVQDGGFSPVFATWFSTLIMLPLGIYLTRRATADRGLFESQGILEPLKKAFGIKKPELVSDITGFNESSSEYNSLIPLDNNQLIDIIKNYRQYDYTLKYKNSALSIINSRGITNQQLKFSGNFANEKLEESLRLKDKYEEDSKLAFILYGISLVLTLVGSILQNNNFPLIGKILFVIGIIAEFIFLISLVRSFISYSNLNKHLGKDSFSNALIFLLLGLPLYIVNYYFQRKKINKYLFINKTNQDHKTISIENSSNKFTSEVSKSILNNYKFNSKSAIIHYSISAVLFVLYFVFKNNNLQPLADASIQISAIALVIFIVYYVWSYINIRKIYNKLNRSESKPNILLLILGLPLYFLVFILLGNKLKEDLKQII